MRAVTHVCYQQHLCIKHTAARPPLCEGVCIGLISMPDAQGHKLTQLLQHFMTYHAVQSHMWGIDSILADNSAQL